MIAYSIMMLSIVDLFFFHAVCILNMLLCTVFFWIFFTISYVFDTIFAMDIPHLFSLLHSVLFFPLYQPPSLSLCMVFDSISSNMDEVLSINPSANLFIFGDFNAHHKDWLVYSGGADRSGELCYIFSVSNDLTQMLNSPTRIPDSDSHSPGLLNFFLQTLVFVLQWLFLH